VKSDWSKHYAEDGRIVYYKCKKAKCRGPQCSSCIPLLYHADSDKVTDYKTEADHDHNDDEVLGIDKNVKRCIEEYFFDGSFFTYLFLVLKYTLYRQKVFFY